MAVSPAAPAAASAAAALGGGADVARAILAQWVCENGDLWPPPDNNPGNVTIGALSSNGIRAGYATGRSVGSHVFARWDSVAAGVAGYVRYVQASPRWAGARLAARSDNGYGFLTGLVAGGWGTGLSCVASAYRSGRGPSGSAAGSGSSGGGIVLASSPGTATTLADLFTTSSRSAPFTQQMLDMLAGDIPVDNPGRDQLLATYRSYLGRPLNTVPFQPHTFYSPTGGLQGPDLTGAVGSLLGNFGWVPAVVVNVALLILVLAFAYSGVRRLVEPVG